MATLQLRLLGLVAVMLVAMSGVHGAREAPSRMLVTEGPPVRFLDCEHMFGTYPSFTPRGSTGWQDGQHANISTLTINSDNRGVYGIETTWVSFLLQDQTIPSFVTFAHGSFTKGKNTTITWPVRGKHNVPYVQVGGTYDNSGLETIYFVDSNGRKSQLWGNTANPNYRATSFLSPARQGYIVGFFGANSATRLTQIGVCMSGRRK